MNKNTGKKISFFRLFIVIILTIMIVGILPKSLELTSRQSALLLGIVFVGVYMLSSIIYGIFKMFKKFNINLSKNKTIFILIIFSIQIALFFILKATLGYNSTNILVIISYTFIIIDLYFANNYSEVMTKVMHWEIITAYFVLTLCNSSVIIDAVFI